MSRAAMRCALSETDKPALAQPWRSVAMANPVVYLVNGLRWTFYGHSDVDIRISAALTLGFLLVCTMVIAAIFRTGYWLRS